METIGSPWQEKKPKGFCSLSFSCGISISKQFLNISEPKVNVFPVLVKDHQCFQSSSCSFLCYLLTSTLTCFNRCSSCPRLNDHSKVCAQNSKSMYISFYGQLISSTNGCDFPARARRRDKEGRGRISESQDQMCSRLM